MKVLIYETVRKMADAAAKLAAGELSRRIAENGRATFIAATGASQFAFPDALTRQPQVDWARTEMFHGGRRSGQMAPADEPGSPNTAKRSSRSAFDQDRDRQESRPGRPGCVCQSGR